MPLLFNFMPVGRSSYFILLNIFPAVGQPQVNIFIATGFHKFQVFFVVNEAVEQAEIMKKNLMMAFFIVVMKPFTIMTYLKQATLNFKVCVLMGMSVGM